jgi:hypothetical protein
MATEQSSSPVEELGPIIDRVAKALEELYRPPGYRPPKREEETQRDIDRIIARLAGGPLRRLGSHTSPPRRSAHRCGALPTVPAGQDRQRQRPAPIEGMIAAQAMAAHPRSDGVQPASDAPRTTLRSFTVPS